MKTNNKLKFYGIMGREKGKGRFKPFDYKEGRFVVNVFHQTFWHDRNHVDKLVYYMNQQNYGYEFKVIERN